MRKLIEAMGGRKVLFGLLITAVGVGVTLYLRDLPQNLMILLSFISTSFFLGNGAEHLAQRGKGASEPLTVPQFQAFVNSLNQVVATQNKTMQEIKDGGDKLVEAVQSGASTTQQLINVLTPKR